GSVIAGLRQHSVKGCRGRWLGPEGVGMTIRSGSDGMQGMAIFAAPAIPAALTTARLLGELLLLSRP
ncbi:hypothetical protein, partial [Rhodopseudomonas sp. B29]|uniref:hypothetical protein n=1 Tax=Rhodopseudomonas sp. B29 TaxID=95607 RepID=UPI001AEC7158